VGAWGYSFSIYVNIEISGNIYSRFRGTHVSCKTYPTLSYFPFTLLDSTPILSLLQTHAFCICVAFFLQMPILKSFISFWYPRQFYFLLSDFMAVFYFDNRYRCFYCHSYTKYTVCTRICILCPRLGAEWIGRISWLPRAPLRPIFMTGLYSVQSIEPTIVLVNLS